MEELEDVKSNTSMGKVNVGFGGSTRASNSGAVSTKKSSLVEKGNEKAEVVKDEEEVSLHLLLRVRVLPLPQPPRQVLHGEAEEVICDIFCCLATNI